jgi:hypothetical protein
MVEKINKCRVLVGKPDKKRPLERTGHRLENRIKMDFNKEVEKCGLDSPVDKNECRALAVCSCGLPCVFFMLNPYPANVENILSS